MQTSFSPLFAKRSLIPFTPLSFIIDCKDALGCSHCEKNMNSLKLLQGTIMEVIEILLK